MPARQSRRSALGWRKSSVSAGDSECVEIACTGPAVLVRDSGHRSGALLMCTLTQWSAFLARVRSGDPQQPRPVKDRDSALPGADDLP
jgi:hypothetical protein